MASKSSNNFNNTGSDDLLSLYAPSYTLDNDLVNEINDLYARVLDRSALNVADPISANLGYFNMSGKKPATDPPMAGKSYIFITRPNLNFRSANNILKSHVFQYYFGSKLGRSLMKSLMQGNAANLLQFPGEKDKQLNYRQSPIGNDMSIGGITMKPEYTLPMIETNFIPMLTNCCSETSNAKDIMIETTETDGDFSGNKLVYAAGADEVLSIGELTLNFNDMYYSPIMHLFIIWVMYIHYVCKGVVNPYWEYIVNRVIDYSCSIYVFMLDMDQETIIRYVRYGGCFPRSIPYGAIQHSQDLNTQALRDIQITFSYNFYEPMNPMTLIDFNMLSQASIINRDPTNKEIAGLFNEKNHALTNDGLYKMLTQYGPKYNKDKYKTDLPTRKIDYIGDENLIAQNADYYQLNRRFDTIYNNWYGIPTIIDGNKLKFV